MCVGMLIFPCVNSFPEQQDNTITYIQQAELYCIKLYCFLLYFPVHKLQLLYTVSMSIYHINRD